MAPIFASTGHHNYVKASRLMIQMYDEWVAKYPTMVHEFFGACHPTVRYSDRERTGTWSDISIKETLMRSTKFSGGQARGTMRNYDSLKVWLHTATHGCKKCELGEPSSVHIGNFSCTLVFTY